MDLQVVFFKELRREGPEFDVNVFHDAVPTWLPRTSLLHMLYHTPAEIVLHLLRYRWCKHISIVNLLYFLSGSLNSSHFFKF